MIEAITGLLGQILYPLFSIIFVLIDLLQMIFTAFAGTGNIFYSNIAIGAGNSGTETDTGIIYYLLQSDIVKNMLFSIAILALFLLVIFTAMAFIKNVYAAKPKGWKDIVGNAFKGLFNFVFIPVCCLLGVWLGNILLNAIAAATSSTGTADLSRQLFTVSAYNANEYRVYGKTDPTTARQIYAIALYGNAGKADDPEVIKIVPEGLTSEQYAELVDKAYGNTKISIYEWGTVEFGYVLFKINYLLLVVGGVFMMYVLVNLAYAMVKRMFILLMLFIISPAMAAMYPLDDGKAIGGWKTSFIQNTIMAYSAVAGMNLFFSLAPIIQNINLLPTGIFFNDLIHIILLIIGLFCVKEFISLINGYIGGGQDALSAGESMRKNTKGAIKKYGKATVSGAFRYGNNTINAYKNSFDAHGKKSRAIGAALGNGIGFSVVSDINKSLSEDLGFKGKDAKGWTDLIKTNALGQAFGDEKEKNRKLKLDEESKQILKDLENDLKVIATGKGILSARNGNQWDAKKPESLIEFAEKMGYGEELSKRTNLNYSKVREDVETQKSLKAEFELAQNNITANAGKRQLFEEEQGASVDVLAAKHLNTQATINAETDENKRNALLAENKAIKEARALMAEEAKVFDSLQKAAERASKSMYSDKNRLASSNIQITTESKVFDSEHKLKLIEEYLNKMETNNTTTNKEIIDTLSKNFKEIKTNSKKD